MDLFLEKISKAGKIIIIVIIKLIQENMHIVTSFTLKPKKKTPQNYLPISRAVYVPAQMHVHAHNKGLCTGTWWATAVTIWFLIVV